MSRVAELKRGQKVGAYLFLILFTVITFLPLLWMLSSSLKLQKEIMLYPLSLPKEITFHNYRVAWSVGNMGRNFINSIIYTGVSTVGIVFLSLAAGFALTKFPFKSRKVYYSLFMTGLLITINSVVAPLFFMEVNIGLYNTYLGVILPYIAFGLPMGVLLTSAYIRGIPNSIIEAALCDGAPYLHIFAKIILPVSVPVIGTVAILSFLRNWNEFILVFILTSGEEMRSLPVSINSFAGRLIVDYGLQFAALTIGTIPMVIFYLFAHNTILKGFGEGALKE